MRQRLGIEHVPSDYFADSMRELNIISPVHRYEELESEESEMKILKSIAIGRVLAPGTGFANALFTLSGKDRSNDLSQVKGQLWKAGRGIDVSKHLQEEPLQRALLS